MSFKLVIGWLYPDLMSIYGDRGNIIVLTRRCEWRGVNVEVKKIGLDSSEKELKTCDLLMMGGAQDTQQTIVAKDLTKKRSALKDMIEGGIPGLYICGGFQFLGKYYKESDGTIIDQLGVLDIYTENPGNRRLIGNIAIKLTGVIANEVKQSDNGIAASLFGGTRNDKIVFVGFENHGGRTILGKDVKPLGKVMSGYGSNDSAQEEGAVYKNTIGTYLHGPILPKNPELADWLIQKALEKKYPSISKEQIQQVIKELDDSIAKKARATILTRIVEN